MPTLQPVQIADQRAKVSGKVCDVVTINKELGATETGNTT